MGRPLGELVIEDEDLENEERLVVVEVIDALTQVTAHCLDVYDSSNSLKYRVGYKMGMVEVNGAVFHGDTLIPINASDKRRIADCLVRSGLIEPDSGE